MKVRLLYVVAAILILALFTKCKDSGLGPDQKIKGKKATLIAPKIGSKQSTSLSLRWRDIEAVESFQIQLSGVKDFSSTIIISSIVDTTRLAVQGLPHHTKLYWRVRPIISGLKTAWSDVWNFSTIAKPDDTEPEPVKLLSPKDGARNRSTNVELSWQTVVNAKEYNIQIADENNFEVLIVDKSVKETTFKNSDLKYSEDYYWRIKAVLPDAKTKWSDIYEFTTVEEAKLSAPVQVSPENDAGNVPLKPDFKWKAVEGADSYLLQVSHSDKAVIEKQVVGATFTPENKLIAEATFHWRVRAIKNGVKGIWSDMDSFTTKPVTPAATLVLPTDEAEVRSASVLLEWEELQGINTYRVQMAFNDYFPAPIVNKSVGKNSYQLSGLENNRTYYWRVQAEGDGNTENWSTVYNFIIKTENGLAGASSDREALMDLYRATNGDRWTNNSGWGSDAPLDSWYGIEANENDRVTRIDLWHNNLKGQLPPSIGQLDQVTYFNVKYNHLTGPIPPEIGKMSSLEELILQGRNYKIWKYMKESPDNFNHDYHQGKHYSNTNEFSGHIPATIGNLSNLEVLELSNAKKITGPIPSEIGNLSNLKGLYLSGNDFSGTTLPASMGNLTNLKHLYIEGAGLVGQIPESFQNLTQLTVLNLGTFDNVGEELRKNFLTGDIPDFSRFTLLRHLVLADNEFTGEFPQYFNNGNFTNLFILNLAGNNLTGTLPEFDKLPNLYSFTAARNKLTGTIETLTDMPAKIKIISVGWNNFSGDFPQNGWPDFYQLKTITVGANPITGRIPCSFWEKLDNPELRVARFGSMKVTDPCPAGAEAMQGHGNIDLTY